MRPNGNNTHCRLRVLFVVKTESLFVLCLFDPSVPDGHDCMQAGGTWAGNTSGYMLAPDWVLGGGTQAGRRSGYLLAPDWT